MDESVKKTDKKPKTGKGGIYLPPGPGRPKGSKNKFTSLKDEFLQAFYDEDGIGGAKGLKELIKQSNSNKMTFLNMIARMLPSNVKVESKTEHSGKLIIEEVNTKE